MAFNFDGIDDRINLAAGGVPAGTSAFTVVVVCKRDVNTAHHIPFAVAGGLSDPLTFRINDNGGADANKLRLVTDVASQGPTVQAGDGWVLVAAGKTGGSATPRFHRYVYATNVWTHQDGDAAAGNWGGADGTDPVRIGSNSGATNFHDGDIAAVAMFDRNLSDAEIERLAFSLLHWHAAAPKAFWVLDQDSTSQKVYDFTGGGADEGSRTGTSVSTSSVPVLNYGLPIIVVTRSGAVTYIKTGSGVLELVGSGIDVFTAVELGAGVLPLVGSGEDAVTAVEAGAAMLPLAGSGLDAVIFVESGIAIAPLTGSGADAVTAVETGAGQIVLIAAGLDQVISAETGAGILSWVGSGVKEFVSAAGIVSRFFDPPTPIGRISGTPGVEDLDPPSAHGRMTSNPSASDFDPPNPKLL